MGIKWSQRFMCVEAVVSQYSVIERMLTSSMILIQLNDWLLRGGTWLEEVIIGGISFLTVTYSIKNIFILHIYVWMPACMPSDHGDHKVLNPLESELEMVVNHMMCMLGTKTRLFIKAASAINHWEIFSAPYLLLLLLLFFLLCV